MFKTKFQQMFAAFVIVALIVGSMGAVVSAAPVAQDVSATMVEGTIDGAAGGDFPKIWLGLSTEPNNQTTTVTIEWDRFDTDGIGFYLLDEAGLNSVLTGSQDVREANLAVSTPLPDTPSNIEGASFKATGSNYTIVVYNDTPQASSFTLSATNGVITNDDGSVTDPDAATTIEADEDATAATDDEAGTDTATTEAAPAAATEPVTLTVTTTTTVTPAADTPAATVTTQSTKLEATEVEGELPNQDDQHYLGLSPDARDANITLSLTYEPQDNDKLARRLNFWVLDQDGFTRYQQTGDRLSTIAIAAGNSNVVGAAANERTANFTASGEGDYTVIVYNSSDVPATYKLVSTNGVLIDESGQTLTAQEQIAATATTTATTPAASTATTDATDATTPAKPASAPAASAAGGTYTVQSGDTLATIARDVYGDFTLYEELCAYNDIENCDVIEVGDVLKLPTADEIGAESMTVPASSMASDDAATESDETDVDSSSTVTDTESITGTESITDTSGITGTETVTGTTASDDAGSAADEDIIDTLIADGNYKNLVAALEAADLLEPLRATGPFTLFAPTDAAFAAFDEGSPGVVELLLVDPTNQLAQILLYHVVSGEYTTASITDDATPVPNTTTKKLVLTTMQGGQLTLTIDDDGSISVNSATISSPDNLATNGVIHGIDNVLLVPTE